jgi:hypothetical protein
MNAHRSIPVRISDPYDHIDALDDAVEASRFDCSPEHLADIAASYPNFGKASPERKALLDQREADREARARAPVGWLTNYSDASDDQVGRLIADLAKGQVAFGKSGIGRKA